MSLSDNLRRLPRERVPTIAVGRDLHGLLMLTRMGGCRTEATRLASSVESLIAGKLLNRRCASA